VTHGYPDTLKQPLPASRLPHLLKKLLLLLSMSFTSSVLARPHITRYNPAASSLQHSCCCCGRSCRRVLLLLLLLLLLQ
jgi:hypothetical protein